MWGDFDLDMPDHEGPEMTDEDFTALMQIRVGIKIHHT